MAVTLDVKIKIRAFTWCAFALNCATHVLGDDVIDGCKPQSTSTSMSCGGEKRGEDVWQILFADAFSIVTEVNGYSTIFLMDIPRPVS